MIDENRSAALIDFSTRESLLLQVKSHNFNLTEAHFCGKLI